MKWYALKTIGWPKGVYIYSLEIEGQSPVHDRMVLIN